MASAVDLEERATKAGVHPLSLEPVDPDVFLQAHLRGVKETAEKV